MHFFLLRNLLTIKKEGQEIIMSLGNICKGLPEDRIRYLKNPT